MAPSRVWDPLKDARGPLKGAGLLKGAGPAPSMARDPLKGAGPPQGRGTPSRARDLVKGAGPSQERVTPSRACDPVKGAGAPSRARDPLKGAGPRKWPGAPTKATSAICMLSQRWLAVSLRHLVGEVNGHVVGRLAVVEQAEARVALVVEHQVGLHAGDQHVGSHVELALVEQQRVDDVPAGGRQRRDVTANGDDRWLRGATYCFGVADF